MPGSFGSSQFSKPATPFNIAGPNKIGAVGPAGPAGPQGPAGAGSTIIASGVSLSTAPIVIPEAVGRNVPTAASFTLVNPTGASISDNTNGPLVWSCNRASVGTNSLTVAQTATPNAATTDFTYTAHITVFGGNVSASGQALPIIGFSDGTKYDVILTASQTWSAGGAPNLAAQTWTNATTNAGNTSLPVGAPNPLWIRFRWLHTTTTRAIDISPDGFTWFTIQTTNTPFLTPTQFVIGANVSTNNPTYPVTVSIDYLVQT